MRERPGPDCGLPLAVSPVGSFLFGMDQTSALLVPQA